MDAPPPQPARRELISGAVAPGLAALREVWRPFVLVLAAGVGVVVAYYTVPSVTRAFAHVAALKARFGFGFSLAAGVLCGCVVAEAVKRLTLPGHRIRTRVGQIGMDAIYFGFMGMLVDGLYRALSALLGEQPTFANATLKMLIDQFVFTPTLGVGIAAVYFPLRESGWDWRQIFDDFGLTWYARRVLPLLVPAWCFWIPMTFLTYLMPPLLQFPFSAAATAAWSMIMIGIARRRIVPPKVRKLAEAEVFNR